MSELTLQEYTQEIAGMLERGAYEEAVVHCQHILKQHPKYVEPYRLIGQAAFDRDDHQLATDMFTRILSANPSDFVSRAGLAVVHDKQGSLKDAVWQMERAFELQPGNAAIQEELRQLYGRRDGVTPDKVPLTRGALARLYMNGELYSEAIAELRALVAREPSRVDLQALLVEALWRGEQRLEASEVALQVLDQMPYCLDANLILGEIWMNGGREEDAEVHLKRALALDPEGKRAAELFGKTSPIPPRPIEISLLDYTPPAAAPVIEEAPQWLSGIGAPAEEAGALAEEIPTWLQGIGLPTPGEAVAEQAVPAEGFAPAPEIGEEIPSWLSGVGVTAPPATVLTPEIEEEAPDWLAQLRQEAEAPAEAAAVPEEGEIPDWLRTLQPEGAEQPAPAVEEVEEAAPDWLAQLRTEAGPVPGEQAATAPEAAEMLDWLRALEPGGAEQVEAPIAEEQPEWLAQLHEQVGTLPGPEEEAAPEAVMPAGAPEVAELPDWLRALKPEGIEEAAPAVEAPEWLVATPEQVQPIEAMPEAPLAPVVEETPPWMTEGAAMPSPEEAMAFFQRLTAGKEAELTAQAEVEAEARLAEITGHKPAPAPKPEPAAPPPPVFTPPPAPAPKAEEVALPGEGAMPSPEEALAFFQRLTAGKEAELKAQAEAEAEARMAEIMGKAAPTLAPKPTPVAPPPAAVTLPPTPAPKPKPAAPPPSRPAPVAPPPPVVTPLPAPAAKVEEVALPGEGAMPSPEEALAFFQRLTAGKEAELKARAEAEAEVRLAEITGRKPAEPARPPEAIVEQPPVEAMEEAPIPAMPEWLAAAPAIEVPTTQEPVPEIPAGWEAIMQPPPIGAWPTEAPVPTLEPEAALPFAAGWPVPEVTPPVVEGVKIGTGPLGAARQPVTAASGPDWWYQTLEDEEGPAEEEAPAEVEPIEGAVPLTEVMAIEETRPAPAPVVPSPVEPVRVEPTPAPAPRAPKRLVRAKPAPATPPKPVVDMDAIMARLRADPDDPQALLDLARGHRQLDNMSAARASYEELIRRGAVLDDVISDLETTIEDRPEDVDSTRLLGDAHMKAGNLQKALKLYRQALKRL